MGIMAGLAAAGAAASLGSTISNSFGGSGGGGGGATGSYGGNPATYIPQAQPSADALYQGIFNNLNGNYGYAQGIVPGLQFDFGKFYQDNPYSMDAQQGANNAAGYGLSTLAPVQQGGAASLYGAGNLVLGTAFDPQLGLYDRLRQQTDEHSNAINSMYGLGSSPYGAGVANQNNTNLSIDWQNQQLQRQIQGIQSAGQAYSGASGLGGSSMATMQKASGLPYQTNLGQLGDIFGQYQNLVTASNPYGNLPNILQSYMRLGQSASNQALAGQQQGFNQSQVNGQNLATSLTNPALGNLFDGVSGYFNTPSYPASDFTSNFGGGLSASDLAGFAGGY